MSGKHLLLYDGVCGLCSRLVRFVSKRDRQDQFRFAMLEGERAQSLLSRHGVEPSDLGTAYVVVDYGEPQAHVLGRARAVLFVLQQLGGVWRVVAWLRVMPTPLLDLGYRVVAALRYRLFGKDQTCRVPAPDERAKFL